MSKFLRLFLPALLAMSLVAAPSMAQEADVVEESAAETVEPVYEDVTMYFHGTERVGDLDARSLERMTMDSTKPTSGDTKSRQVLNYVRGPNNRCSGNWIAPSWDGFVGGTVAGDMRVVLNTLAHPGARVVVDVFADGGGGCNDAYVEPVASKVVVLPAGQGETEVVFEDVNFDVLGSLTVMLHAPANDPVVLPDPAGPQARNHPDQSRVFYDSTTAGSRIEFQCLLPEGKSTCLS